jgi:ATP-dependent helicase/nuclease subunit A
VAESASIPPDQKYRDRIAAELDRTMLIEAAAGTGKTTCLITRMVSLLGEGKCQVETLAAVTFTRKAAAELRARFQLAVEKAANASSGNRRKRLAGALSQIERCFIGTIHSFCGRLLRERPVEAGVDPRFVELDETVDDQLRRRAWREHVAAMTATDAPILPELERLGLQVSPSTRRRASLASELDELGLEPAELGPAFLRYAEYSDVDDWPAVPVPLPDLEPCIEALKDYAAHMQALSLPADYGNDKLIPKYELISRMVQQLDLNQPAELMEVLEQFGRASVVQRNWLGKKAQALAELDRWNHFAQQYAQPLLLAWRQHRYEPVMRAIRPARDVYDRLRRERNGLNFQDLLQKSAALLRDKPQVRRYFRQRFTHLLVDEFQDTDPIQAEVMLLATADDANETNWQKCRPVPGSLFVVGDPKQSIYRFRRADILTYGKVLAIVENSGGEVIPLTANFRSVQPIVHWVNGCFSQIFPLRADDYSPADRPLRVGRADAAFQVPAIRRLAPPATIKRNDQVSLYEADVIARTIRRAIDEKWPVPRTEAERQEGLPEHAQAGDFLLVARSKKRLTTYARKLQQHGVPHIVTGGSVLNEVPELGLLHTCVSAVARPDDPVALVAVLRSEVFGIADTVLYSFRRHGGRFSYNSEMPAGLPPEEVAALKHAFDRLRVYSQWLRQMPTAAAIERIAAHLGLIARACAGEEGGARAGSLLKAIELLRSIDGPLTAADYVEALGRLVDQAEPHDGVPVLPPAEKPVRVMNLHQCKGLEAPFVFLVDPSGESDHDIDVHIDRSGDKPRGYLPVYGLKRNKWSPPPVLAHPPDWDQLAAREQQFLRAESNRLLYVAATRAGVQLVISQREGEANQKNPWHLLDHHLGEADKFPDPGTVTPKEPVELKYDAAEWQNEVAAIDERWRTVLQPTYAVQAIKESTIKGGPKPHGAEQGGAEWGTVLHTLLEAAMNRPGADLHDLAASLLEGEELPALLADDAVATAKRVMSSRVWNRAAKALRCLTEVPLGTPVAAHETGAELPTVLRGVIDLIFRETSGWVIVDYKTERVGARDIPALVNYYRPQIEAYGNVWERIVDQTVGERGLLFTHTGEYVTV